MPGERGEMKYRYVGKRQEGEHLSGIPTTNLYEADWDALSPEQRREVERSAIYKKIEHEASADEAAPSTSTRASASRKAGGEDK